MRVSLGIAWYDLWMGAYYDRAKRTLYICPLPCIVVKLQPGQEGGAMANDNERKLGPNAKRLLSRLIARAAVPPGGGLESSLRFFADAEHRHRVLEVAMENLDASITLIRQAPDNPYGDDEEDIAAGILARLEGNDGHPR